MGRWGSCDRGQRSQRVCGQLAYAAVQHNSYPYLPRPASAPLAPQCQARGQWLRGKGGRYEQCQHTAAACNAALQPASTHMPLLT